MMVNGFFSVPKRRERERERERFLLLATGSSPKFISLNNNNNTLIMDEQMNGDQKAHI